MHSFPLIKAYQLFDEFPRHPRAEQDGNEKYIQEYLDLVNPFVAIAQ